MAKYQAVRVAEKRKMLEDAGESWPVCDCCELPKVWKSDSNRKAGGAWRLRCTINAAHRRYAKKPGTYTFNKQRGIGEPGAIRRDSMYRLMRTPGAYERERRLAEIEDRMQKYIPGTPEYTEHAERIRKEWQMSYAEQS